MKTMKRARKPYERMMRLLSAIALAVGAVATLSYGSGAEIAVRYLDPPAGAWWNEHEYYVMITAGAAWGMLIAIRMGARLVEGESLRQRATAAALIAGAVILPVAASYCARIARLGWAGESGAIDDRLVAIAGWDVGNILDKVLIAGVYFLKVAGFALIAGLAVFAAAVAAALAAQGSAGERAEGVSR
jgi:hypothetical protein